MQLQHLKKSITQLTSEEAFELVKKRRLSRRVMKVKLAKKREVKKKARVEKWLKLMTVEEIEKVLREFE